MKRSSSAVALGAMAGVLIAVLSGCSIFKGLSSSPSQSVPGASISQSGEPSAETLPSAEALPSVTPSGSPPSVGPAAPTPSAVPGYTLASPKDTVHRQFEAVRGQFKGVFSGLTSRTVVKDKQQVGSLVLLGLQQDLVGNTQVEQRLVPGMVKGMSGEGAKVTTRKVGGQSVVVATTKSTNIIAWYQSGTVALVLGNGTDPAQSLTFAKDYLAAR